jgi:hypothetical protein
MLHTVAFEVEPCKPEWNGRCDTTVVAHREAG